MNKAERHLLSVIALLLVIGGGSRLWFSAAEPSVSWEPTPDEELVDRATEASLAEQKREKGKDSAEVKPKKSPKKQKKAAAKPAPLRAGERININTANAKQLQRLPGVGPAMAERMIAYREEHGPFDGPESLLKVKGIGKTRLDSLRLRITFQK